MALVQSPPTATRPSPHGGGSRPGNFEKDPLFVVETEEHRVCDDRAWWVPCPEDLGLVPDCGQDPDPYLTLNSESRSDSE